MFAAIARRYDLNNRLHSIGRDQAWRRRAVALSGLTAGDHVLDVACGTGDLTEAFCRARPRPKRVVGLDFTPEMLDVAREKAAKRERRQGMPTPEYVQGDAMNLPFDDASFDVVSIAFGIRNVAEPAKALEEFRRVMRPGGRLVVLEFSQPRNGLLRTLNAIYCNRIMPITATLLAGAGGRSGAYHYLPKSVATFEGGDREHMLMLMRNAGFANESALALTFGVCCLYRGVSRVAAT